MKKVTCSGPSNFATFSRKKWVSWFHKPSKVTKLHTVHLLNPRASTAGSTTLSLISLNQLYCKLWNQNVTTISGKKCRGNPLHFQKWREMPPPPAHRPAHVNALVFQGFNPFKMAVKCLKLYQFDFSSF